MHGSSLGWCSRVQKGARFRPHLACQFTPLLADRRHAYGTCRSLQGERAAIHRGVGRRRSAGDEAEIAGAVPSQYRGGRRRLARPISILKVIEEVEVLGMAPQEESKAKCLSGSGAPAGELRSLWRNCNRCQKIKRPERPSEIGSAGWIAATSYERHQACRPTCVAAAYRPSKPALCPSAR
jgi:hypothetical protein